MRRWVLLSVLIVMCRTVSAQTEEALARADACLTRLQEIVDELARREDEAVQSNQLARAACIRRKHSTVAGLVTAMKPVHKRLPSLAEENETEVLEEELDRVLSACARSEEMLTAANACREETPFPEGSAIRRRPRRRDELTKPARPYTPEAAAAPGPRSNCFRQERLACLLIQAMELEVGDDPAAIPCTERLARREITPWEDWDATRCVTVEDFAVVVARALALPVEDPDDPASYLQAMRDEGLPVGLLLPGTRTAPATSVTEEQARAFFASGYAGSFPSLPR